MHKLIIPLYITTTALSFILGQHLPLPPPTVEADRVTHVLPDSRDLTKATPRRFSL
jgi:hypothetical protein